MIQHFNPDKRRSNRKLSHLPGLDDSTRNSETYTLRPYSLCNSHCWSGVQGLDLCTEVLKGSCVRERFYHCRCAFIPMGVAAPNPAAAQGLCLESSICC